ncbi:MAG: pentapeptide repeat-containing protein [Hyphomonadaceae bacterium]|nr:pentapeptide repeat-containing protein [Hyphomonadaceae bacterium]MBC6413213.1 pentapeptide repeat-containing protein [Hyphomonadaceae bacterium]
MENPGRKRPAHRVKAFGIIAVVVAVIVFVSKIQMKRQQDRELKQAQMLKQLEEWGSLTDKEQIANASAAIRRTLQILAGQEVDLASFVAPPGVNLSEANLGFAHLTGADLSGATLSFADLPGADLRGVDFSGADIRNADFLGADLSGADLSGAILIEATLRDVDFRGVDFSDADLSDVDFRWAQNLTQGQLNCAMASRSPIFLPEDLEWPFEGADGKWERKVGDVYVCMEYAAKNTE